MSENDSMNNISLIENYFFCILKIKMADFHRKMIISINITKILLNQLNMLLTYQYHCTQQDYNDFSCDILDFLVKISHFLTFFSYFDFQTWKSFPWKKSMEPLFIKNYLITHN